MGLSGTTIASVFIKYRIYCGLRKSYAQSHKLLEMTSLWEKKTHRNSVKHKYLNNLRHA